MVGTEEFMSLSYDLLKEIISSEELHVQSEEQVYDAIVQWVRHDLEHRRTYFSKVSTFEIMTISLSLFSAFNISIKKYLGRKLLLKSFSFSNMFVSLSVVPSSS